MIRVSGRGIEAARGPGDEGMTDAKRKLYLVEGGPTPSDAVAASLEPLFDVEVVPVERAAEVIEQFPGQAVLTEGLDAEGRDRLLGTGARHIVEAIGDGVCVFEVGKGVTWSSGRFQSLGKHTHERVAAECAAAIERFNAATKNHHARADSRANADPGEHDHGLKFTLRDEAADGRERFFETLISPVRWTAGRVEVVVAVLWDVTESTRTEMKLDAIDRAGAELVRLDADVVKRLNAADRISLLEEKIVKAAHERLEFDHFTIHLLNRENNRLELVMSEGLPPEVQEVDLYARREGNGIVGYVAATGRPYLCRRTTTDERYIQGLTSAASSLTVPLLMHDQVIGVFNIESEREDAFSEADRQFAEMFARYVALAFHILDLLVVERYTTGETVSSTMEVEISEPLDDLSREAQWLKDLALRDPEAAEHAERIVRDIESIRRRVTGVRRGPRSILGVEQALKEPTIDPLLKDRRILVVDDEPGIRETVADILARRGASIVMHERGAEALAALDEAAAPGARRFDMVISDIKLPDCKGYEIFAAALRHDPDVYVILMTGFGYDPHHSIVRASQEGLQCVLFKPFRAQRLLDEVRKPFLAAQQGQLEQNNKS